MASSVPGPLAIIEELPSADNTRQWRLLDEPGGAPRSMVVGHPRSDGTLLLDCWPCGYACGHIDLVRATLEHTGA
jgi:hypothetical protein